jgi:basic amino acid/polyamine antiporter, APA family
MARRRLHGLQRVLGVNALASTAYGNVGSSIYYALGLVAGYALGLTPVVFVVSGFIFYLTAATYSEATAMYPEAGGSSSFARHAFNEFWSFFAAWGQMLNYTITIAISAFFVPHYLGGVLGVDELRHGPLDIVFAIGVVAVLAFVNVRGAEESAGVNVALALIDFATQLLLVVLGFFLVFNPEILVDNVHFGVAPTATDFILAIPVAMIAYTGIETISNMAEEAKDEARTIPKAIKRVVIAVFVIYAALPAMALSALPVYQDASGEYTTKLAQSEAEGGFAGDPVLGIVKNMDLGIFQNAGEIYVGLLAATILFIATNAGIIGVSRLVYSMGMHRQLPERASRLHAKYGTPAFGIVVFSAFACLAITTGQADFLGNMYAFGAMLSFTIAHAAVVKLRSSKRDVPRPYRGPMNLTVGGRDIPVFAVLGGIFTALAFLVVTILHVSVAIAGATWLAVGVGVYVAFRKRQGLDLTTTTKVALPRPVTDREAEYESVLVAVEAREYPPGLLMTATRIAARRKRGIHVLVLITVPSSSPIDAALPEQEEAAQAIVEQARLKGGNRVSGRFVKVRAGQAGRTIVQEARHLGSRAIVLPLPPRPSPGTGFGRTVETVLAERPCRVIIQTDPSGRLAKNHAEKKQRAREAKS